MYSVGEGIWLFVDVLETGIDCFNGSSGSAKHSKVSRLEEANPRP